MGAGALPPDLGMAVQGVALQQNRLIGVLSPTLIEPFVAEEGFLQPAF